MRLRILILSSCLAAGLAPLVAASPASAQPPSAQASPPGPRGFDVEARVLELQQRLQLDATQTGQVRTILTDARDRMVALRGSGPHDEQLRRQRRAILFQVEDRVWAILSCPQKDAFRLYIREQLEERFERRMDRHGPPHGRGGRHGHGPGGHPHR